MTTQTQQIPQIPDDLLDALSEHCRTQGDIQELTKLLWKSLLEKALDAEMDLHLQSRPDLPATPQDQSADQPTPKNRRNGHSKKTVKGPAGAIPLEIPRDRDASFEPAIVPKHQRNFERFDEKILALYAKGMSTRDIQLTLEQLYQVEVSTGFISTVTDAVAEEFTRWQARPLDEVYPIVYLDAIVVKVHAEGRVVNRSICVALGVNMQGQKELLGLWICENEGAKFWLGVLTDLAQRGCKDIFFVCVDGLSGFPEAIGEVYPRALTQQCVVHMVRNSLKYVTKADMYKVAASLKKIYNAATLFDAEQAFDQMEEDWGEKYPMIVKQWKGKWESLIVLFEYPDEIRRVIYTTNAIESVNSVIRKAIKNRKIFPSEQSALKVVYLAIVEASKNWEMPIAKWKSFLNRMAIEFEDRFPHHLV